jgi:hypothetical protein
MFRFKNNPFMTFDNVNSEPDQIIELVKDPDGNLFVIKLQEISFIANFLKIGLVAYPLK